MSSANTKPTVLLTLGRLPPAVDIARSFDAAGWRVLVADPFRWHLARTSRAVAQSFVVPAPHTAPSAYLDALLDIVREHAVTLVVPISEETMHAAALKARLPADCDWFGSDSAVVRMLHSKYYFVQTARSAGLQVPETARGAAPSAKSLADRGDVFVKPEYSCSGRAVRRWAAGSDLADLPRDVLVQQAIDGDEVSAMAIAQHGKVVAQCVYRAVVRHGSVAVVFERINQPEVDHWLATLVAQTSFHGFISIDAIIDADQQVYAIECNPRASSGLHFFRTADIANVITGQIATARYKPHMRLQEFWSAWTHYLSVLTKPSARRATWAAIRQSRDVSWQRADPRVFLLATFSTWPIISLAIRKRATFAEVLALDIEWPADNER